MIVKDYTPLNKIAHVSRTKKYTEKQNSFSSQWNAMQRNGGHRSHHSDAIRTSDSGENHQRAQKLGHLDVTGSLHSLELQRGKQ